MPDRLRSYYAAMAFAASHPSTPSNMHAIHSSHGSPQPYTHTLHVTAHLLYFGRITEDSDVVQWIIRQHQDICIIPSEKLA